MLKEPKRIIAEEPRAPDYSDGEKTGCDGRIKGTGSDEVG